MVTLGAAVVALSSLSRLLPRRAAAQAGVAGDAAAPFHHLPDGAFRNNYITPAQQAKGLPEMMRWRREAPDVVPITFPRADSDPALLAKHDAPRIAWIGHATVLIQAGGLNILTDPQFSDSASPLAFVGFKRATPPGIALADLPPIDVVLLSHNHYDHLDADSIRALTRHSPDARYLVPLRLADTLRRYGVGAGVIAERDWGGDVRVGGARFVAEPCQHWSRRGLWDRNKTLWASWVIESGGLRFLFIGDTGYSRDFADLGAKYGGFDVGVIPIGAYEPRWFMQNSHANPAESAQIFRDINCRFALPTHWGSFILTDEPMDEPPQKLREAVAANGIDAGAFAVFQHGEIRDLSFLRRA